MLRRGRKAAEVRNLAPWHEFQLLANISLFQSQRVVVYLTLVSGQRPGYVHSRALLTFAPRTSARRNICHMFYPNGARSVLLVGTSGRSCCAICRPLAIVRRWRMAYTTALQFGGERYPRSMESPSLGLPKLKQVSIIPTFVLLALSVQPRLQPQTASRMW